MTVSNAEVTLEASRCSFRTRKSLWKLPVVRFERGSHSGSLLPFLSNEETGPDAFCRSSRTRISSWKGFAVPREREFRAGRFSPFPANANFELEGFRRSSRTHEPIWKLFAVPAERRSRSGPIHRGNSEEKPCPSRIHRKSVHQPGTRPRRRHGASSAARPSKPPTRNASPRSRASEMTSASSNDGVALPREHWR